MKAARLHAWCKRHLPAEGARYVEVRDGEVVLSRLTIESGSDDGLRRLADEIQETIDSAEARSLAVVAIRDDGSDGASLTVQRPATAGQREQRSLPGWTAALLRENEQLRTRNSELVESTMRALLSENQRLRESQDMHEKRRLEFFERLEELRSEQALRDAQLTEQNESRAQRQRAIAELKKLVPAIRDYLTARPTAELRSKLGSVVKALLQSPGHHFEQALSELPAEHAADVQQILDVAMGKEPPKRAIEKRKNGAPS